MNKINIVGLVISFFCCSVINAQNFTIRSENITIEGQASNDNFYMNTYLDSHSEGIITWNILNDSMPENWEFSNCFPNCLPVGVTNGSFNIVNDESYYLNCHFYPNNTPGEGFITMQITDGDITKLVSWHGIAASLDIINQWSKTNKPEIRTIYNLNGKIVNEFKPNQIFVVEFNDNSIKKIFVGNP